MSQKTPLGLFSPQVRTNRTQLHRTSLIHVEFSGSRKSPSLPWPDIGHLAKWSVSSYKFGFGAECLHDGDPDTFWQYVFFAPMNLSIELRPRSSDGPQPHFITIEFPRKVAIQVRLLHMWSGIITKPTRKSAYFLAFSWTIRILLLRSPFERELAQVIFKTSEWLHSTSQRVGLPLMFPRNLLAMKKKFCKFRKFYLD